jgi:hypothetical protein
MDPVALITSATTDFSADLGGVAGIGLGVGAGIFALTKGWSLLKRFVN